MKTLFKIAFFSLFLLSSLHAFAEMEMKCKHCGMKEGMGMMGGMNMEMKGHDFLPIFPGVVDSEKIANKGPCADLNLDSKQKESLKENYFKYKESQIDLKARLEKAHMEEEKIENDPKANFDAANSASKNMISAMTELMQQKAEYKNKMMFEILKPEQRESAHKCLKEIKKHNKHEGHEKKPRNG